MFAHAQASQNTNAPQRKDALIADLNTTHQFVSLANQVKIQAKRPKNKKTKHNQDVRPASTTLATTATMHTKTLLKTAIVTESGPTK